VAVGVVRLPAVGRWPTSPSVARGATARADPAPSALCAASIETDPEDVAHGRGVAVPPSQGCTPGVLAFADRLALHRHTVHVPDLYEADAVRRLEQGVAHAQAVGFDTVISAAARAARDSRKVVYIGFSAWGDSARCSPNPLGVRCGPAESGALRVPPAEIGGLGRGRPGLRSTAWRANPTSPDERRPRRGACSRVRRRRRPELFCTGRGPLRRRQPGRLRRGGAAQLTERVVAFLDRAALGWSAPPPGCRPAPGPDVPAGIARSRNGCRQRAVTRRCPSRTQ